MILAKIKEEEISNFPISRKQKLLNRIKNPFRTTAFTIQKRKTLDQNLTLSPEQFSRAKSPQPGISPQKSGNYQNPQQSCSNFMKSYVQKLKRQRKRDKKRLSLLHQNQSVQQEAPLGCDLGPLPLIHNGKQQILIFQKIVPNSFKPSIPQVPSASTFNNQKIAHIMQQIKKYKSKGTADRSQFRKKIGDGFPALQKKNLLKKFKDFESVDPWQGENQFNDHLLQQYK